MERYLILIHSRVFIYTNSKDSRLKTIVLRRFNLNQWKLSCILYSVFIYMFMLTYCFLYILLIVDNNAPFSEQIIYKDEIGS